VDEAALRLFRTVSVHLKKKLQAFTIFGREEGGRPYAAEG